MKKTDRKSGSSPVPRLNSLLHRLQKAPGQKDESYLDELMLFLDNANSGDRWLKGAEMCAVWGVPTSHTSVYRLFRSYAIQWRARLALETPADDGEKPEILEERASQMVSRRTCEILADPDSSPTDLISLARIDLRKKMLEFARQKHEDLQRTPLEEAVLTIQRRSIFNFEAQFAIERLKEAWEHPKPPLAWRKFQEQQIDAKPAPESPADSASPHA